MQKLFLATAILISTILVSCEGTGLTTAPEVEPPLEVLNYDGANQDAPEFEGSTDIEGAVLFPSTLISAFEGGKLTRIQYYIKQKPSSANLKIYEKTTSSGAPDKLIYTAALSSEITADSWNEHEISAPITISREDIWISIGFNHVNTQRTLGCDRGPAVSNGDWLLLDGIWEPLSSVVPSININWNIRAVIDPL